MREPFPYESNADLIREILVTSAITDLEWEQILSHWKPISDKQTILEYLVAEKFTENELIEILLEGQSVPVSLQPDYAVEENLDASGQMLQQHGFKVLQGKDYPRRVAGGPCISPDLGVYLGSDARHWQWVLASPVRTRNAENGADPVPARVENEYAVSNWLRELISSLWSEEAADIHFESQRDDLIIRAKFPHGIKCVGKWEKKRMDTVTRLISRWAGVANWDRKTFIDGTIGFGSMRSSTEFRVSLIPTVTGASIVLRAPSVSVRHQSLKQLGLPESLRKSILDTVLHRPGMIICTGKTGSGKTTSLYGILNEIEPYNLKILTIEDPVERVVPFAVQSNVDEQNGWTFDKAIHSFLRQDPDVILLGEIRDQKSAEAACRAALTGHCVLSTMHAGDAQAAIKRLKLWNVPNGILREALRLVINQKLIKRSCDLNQSREFNYLSSFN